MTPMCENMVRYGYCLDPNCWSCAEYDEMIESDRAPPIVAILFIAGACVVVWVLYKLLSQL